MHAIPNNTGPRIAWTCLTFIPEAALRAEPDGFALVVTELVGDPPTTAVAVVEPGALGKERVAVTVPDEVPVLDPMKPPDTLEGAAVVVAEPAFLSTILKLAQAMRVLLA